MLGWPSQTLIEPLCKADVNLNFNLSRLKFQNKREVIRPTLRVSIISLICIQVKKSLTIVVISAYFRDLFNSMNI